MELVLLVVGSVAILLTVVPLIHRDDWWIRFGDFPRGQIAVGLAATLAAYAALVWEPWEVWSTVFVGALGVCFLYQSARMYPYTRLSRTQVQETRKREPEATFSLLVANVLMTNRDAADLRKIVRGCDPDVFLAVETDEWWREQLRETEASHPFTVHCPLPNTYGMLLYSRLELLDPEIRFLVQDDIPSIHTGVELASGDRIELHCVHPRPPTPTENDRSTERDAELLLVGRSIRGSERPVVVAGDLNDVAWSQTTRLFQKISGLLDPRVGRGFFSTFHAKYPFLRWPLDHVFHSEHFHLIDLRRLGFFGSDHFPIFISLSYEPSAVAEQKTPEEADAGDQEEADEKIARAGAAEGRRAGGPDACRFPGCRPRRS